MATTAYEKQRAIVRIGLKLQQTGWTIFGFKEDQSDAMTDYFSPASWHGIATHKDYPGIIVGVGVTKYDIEVAERKDFPVPQHITPQGKGWHIERDGLMMTSDRGWFNRVGGSGAWEKSRDKTIDKLEAAVRKIDRLSDNSPVIHAKRTHQVIIVANDNRTQVYFPGKPSVKVRNALRNFLKLYWDGESWASNGSGTHPKSEIVEIIRDADPGYIFQGAEPKPEPAARKSVTLKSFDNGSQFGYEGVGVGIWGPYRDIGGQRHYSGWTVWGKSIVIPDPTYDGPGMRNLGGWSLAKAVRQAEDHFGVDIILEGKPVWDDEYPKLADVVDVQIQTVHAPDGQQVYRARINGADDWKWTHPSSEELKKVIKIDVAGSVACGKTPDLHLLQYSEGPEELRFTGKQFRLRNAYSYQNGVRYAVGWSGDFHLDTGWSVIPAITSVQSIKEAVGMLEEAWECSVELVGRPNLMPDEFPTITAEEIETLTVNEALDIIEEPQRPENNPAQTLTVGMLDAVERVDQAEIVPSDDIEIRIEEFDSLRYAETQKSPHSGVNTMANNLIPDWALPFIPGIGKSDKDDPIAWIKLFTPTSNWTWLITEYDPDDKLAFGLVDGFETELGYISIEELESMESSKLPGLKLVEREVYTSPEPLRSKKEYKKEWGENGPYKGRVNTISPKPAAHSAQNDDKGDGSKRETPPDILIAWDMLSTMRESLSDLMMSEYDEWDDGLKAAIQDWTTGGTDPDWQAWRDEMNAICRDDAMPALFPDPEDAPDEPAAVEGAVPEPTPEIEPEPEYEAGDYVLACGYRADHVLVKIISVGGWDARGGFRRYMVEFCDPHKRQWVNSTSLEDGGAEGGLRKDWDTRGVPLERQDAIIAEVDRKASPEGNAEMTARLFPAKKKLLPSNWTENDIRYLLEQVNAGLKVLTGSQELGIPTIHDPQNVEHTAFGVMRARADEYDITFDAGGAMERTPSGKGWTSVLENSGSFPYDFDAVRATLTAYLPADPAEDLTDEQPVEEPTKEPTEAMPAEADQPGRDVQAEYDEWELHLLTGTVVKKRSAFWTALKEIQHPGTLRLAMENVNGDQRRRAALEKRLKQLQEVAPPPIPKGDAVVRGG